MSGSAWGLSLFQSDYDYDIIQNLGFEAGIWNIEEVDSRVEGKKAIYVNQIRKVGLKQAEAQSVRDLEHNRADQCKTQTKKDKEIHYSLYAALCSHPERVKKYLEVDGGDVPGKVSVMYGLVCKKWIETERNKDDPSRPGYALVVLAACAMSLGCKLTDPFLNYLRGMYANRKCVGLMRDAFAQMRKALFGPDGYKNDGTPYDFGSPGFYLTKKNGGPPVEDRFIPGMVNVPSPSGICPDEVVSHAVYTGAFTARSKAVKYLHEKYEAAIGGEVEAYGMEVCGGCGKKGSDGMELVKCSRCQTRKYCGKECQKKDWAKHKKVCEVKRDEKEL